MTHWKMNWKISAALLGSLTMAALMLGFMAVRPAVTSADAGKVAPAAPAAQSLEDRIKELGVPYKSVGDGKFLVAFSVDDTATTNMLLGETSMASDDSGKMITIACKVADGTKDKKPTALFLSKITDFDYQTDIGRVGLDSSNNVWYQSSLWEANATKDTLIYDMLYAHTNRQKVAKTLKAISEEG